MRQASVLERPLNWVFSAPSHVAVLRALRDSREGMSGRAVARAAGVNHQACAAGLKRLESLGIIQRQGAGKTQLVRLNFNHFLVKEALLPLLRRERDLQAQIRELIRNELKTSALSATIFGSTARGEAEPGSDIDVLVLVRAEGQAKTLKKVHELAAVIRDRYGIRLSGLVLTPRMARATRYEALMQNIRHQGSDLLPTRFQQILP